MIILLIASFILFLFSFSIPRKKLNYYFLFMSIVLSIIAFFCVPFETMDLYRHYQTMEIFRVGGWHAVTEYRYSDSLPLFGIYFYLISLLKLNGFLPAITVFITYYLTFKNINKVALKFNAKKQSILLGTLFFVATFNYFALLSGIRNMLAFSIFAYFLYIDLVEKKNRIGCWIVYIALCLFHSSTVILVLFRILLLVYNKFSGKILNSLLLVWSVGILIILNILNSLTNIDFFQLLTLQLESYSDNEYYVLLPAIVKAFTLIVIVILFVYFMSTKKNQYKEMEGIFRFITMLITFTIGSLTNYHIFIRFVEFLSLLSPLYIILLLNNETQRYEISKFKYIEPYVLKTKLTSNLVLLIILTSIPRPRRSPARP